MSFDDYYFCDNCGVRSSTKHYCFDCDYCKKCCLCPPKFFNSKLTFHEASTRQRRQNKSQRLISAEIEVASVTGDKKAIEKVVRKWNGNIVRDASLPESGFEINTAPAGGDIYVKQIRDICGKLAKANARISSRCGLHVHLDARDYNFNDLNRLIKVYAAIEPALFSMVPANRHTSKYCIKCGDKLEQSIQNSYNHLQLKEKVITAVYNEPNSIAYRDTKRGAGPGTGRYYALNLHSWFYRGTIECRLFDGTVDPDEIINWGVMWAKVLDFSLHSSDDEIARVANKNKSRDTLINIVNDDNLAMFIDYRTKLNGKAKKEKKLPDAFLQSLGLAELDTNL